MTRWKQHGFNLLAVALITAAGGAAYGQLPGRGAPTVAVTAGAAATVGVGAKPGPAEKAGEKVDKALDKAGEKVDKAGDKAEEKLDKAGEKAEEKLDKAGEKAEEKLDKAADKVEEKLDEAGRAKKKAQIEATAKTERMALKGKVEAALKGHAMTEAMKQELKRHARRLARLERVKTVAKDAKDDEAATRVDKLIEKENARHTKWMAGFDAKAEVKTDVKAGAK